MSQRVWAHRNKEEETERGRGAVSTTWMKEIIRDVPGCFIGRRQQEISENIAELSLYGRACVCVCVSGVGCLNCE